MHRLLMRTAPGCCCSHVPGLLTTQHPCLSGRRASRPATVDKRNSELYFTL